MDAPNYFGKISVALFPFIRLERIIKLYDEAKRNDEPET